MSGSGSWKCVSNVCKSSVFSDFKCRLNSSLSLTLEFFFISHWASVSLCWTAWTLILSLVARFMNGNTGERRDTVFHHWSCNILKCHQTQLGIRLEIWSICSSNSPSLFLCVHAGVSPHEYSDKPSCSFIPECMCVCLREEAMGCEHEGLPVNLTVLMPPVRREKGVKNLSIWDWTLPSQENTRANLYNCSWTHTHTHIQFSVCEDNTSILFTCAVQQWRTSWWPISERGSV